MHKRRILTYITTLSNIFYSQKAKLDNSNMRIGIPIEIKADENRVALTPSGAYDFIKRGHEVYIQKGAGFNSGFPDEAYVKMGAKIKPDIQSVYQVAEMILKVKEPLESEYDLIRKDQIIFTYLHLASSQELTHALIETEAICIGYETVEKASGKLPLLIPMSEIAGRMSVQEGAKYLEKPFGGKGVLLGGVPGVRPGRVMILGGGVVGTEAAKMAAGLGAQVLLLDINLPRLRQLENILPANVTTMFSTEQNIRKLVPKQDLIIGAILTHGAKATKLITRDMLSTMEPETVLVDVAIDQGGCMETSRVTTHRDPTFTLDGVVHYGVANIPGAVPRTSTLALTNVTLPYALLIADHGWKKACKKAPELTKGVNIVGGKVTYPAVADTFGLPKVDVQSVL